MSAITIKETEGYVLTIYVLAFHNPDCVSELLESLLPFSFTDVCIVVADNSQDRSVLDRVDSLRKHFGEKLFYYPYGTNIGLGTLIRGFEIVLSKYIWMVGACNTFVREGVAELVEELTSRDPDVLLHQEDQLARATLPSEAKVYHDIAHLMAEHSFSVMCSINSFVYNTGLMRPFVTSGYESMSSLTPHTGMLIEAICTRKAAVTYVPVKAFSRHPRPRSWPTAWYLENLHSVVPTKVPASERREILCQILKNDAWLVDELIQFPKSIPQMVAHAGIASLGAIFHGFCRLVYKISVGSFLMRLHKAVSAARIKFGAIRRRAGSP